MKKPHGAIGRPLWLALVFALCAVSVSAYQATGTLRGRVIDKNQDVVLGTTVNVIDAAGVAKTATTGQDGSYTLTGLAPGKYTVRAEAPGFAAYEEAGVEIAGSAPRTLDILLNIEIREAVEVNNSETRVNVEADGGTNSIVLRGAELGTLSDDPDQLAEDLRALAGGGEGPNGSQIFVDGFSRGRIPPKSSILEVRINSNPFTAEQDDLGFGRIEITTKPGAEKRTGSAFMNFNDESLNARNPFAPNRAPFQSRLFGASLSGPIVAKKLSFFTDFEGRDISENAIVTATVLGGAGNAVPFRQVVITPQRRSSFSQRLDYQLSKRNTLVARYNFTRFTFQNAGVGGFALPSRAFDTTTNEHTLQLSNTMIVSPTLVNVTRFQFVRNRREQQGSDAVVINVQDAFSSGGSSIGDAFNNANSYELQNLTTWLRGAHTWNFGGRLRAISRDESAPTNFGGTFVFSSLEQFRQVTAGVPGARPAQFTIAGGDPRAAIRQYDLGLFVQNDWRLRRDFMLSLGMRFETQNNINDKFDLAPRVAFAWAPKALNKGDTPKTVIRGGGGIFYYRFGEDLSLDARRFNGVNQQRFIITNPDFYPLVPSAETLLANALPQTTRRVASDLETPYSIKTTISIEHQLPRNLALSVIYIYERDRQLVRSRNINAPLPGTFNPTVPGSGQRPFGNVGNIFLFESGGLNNDNTVFVNVNGRLHKKVSIFTRLGLSHETGDVDDAYTFPSNPYDLASEYGRATGDVRLIFNGGVTYTAPWGITVNSLMRFLTPGRFNITTGRDNNGDGVFADRPAFATDLSKPGVVVTPFGSFDPNPEPGQQIIPRNYGAGPSFAQIHLRATKVFRFGSTGAAGKDAKRPAEKPYSLMLGVQALNIFNRNNAGQIVGNLSSPLFGDSISTAGTPRRVDLLLRFTF